MDEDGNIQSREFLAEELIEDEVEGSEVSQEEKSRLEKVQRLKPGTTDIVNLVRTPEEIPKEIIVSVPKTGTSPLDIRISSEVTPDLPSKEDSRQPSDVLSLDNHAIVHLNNGARSDEQTSAGHDSTAMPLTFSFTRDDLDQYVAYRNEGLAKKSRKFTVRGDVVSPS